MAAPRMVETQRSLYFFATQPPDLPWRSAQRRFAKAPLVDPTEAQERSLVENSLRILDLALFTACLLEAIAERKIHSVEQLVRSIGDVIRDVEVGSGRQIEALVESAAEALTPRARDQMKADLRSSIEAPPVEETARFVRAVVGLCPIDRIEEAATSCGMLEEGHACRETWSRLRAWLVRNDPSADTRTRVLGEAYARGALTASEIGAVLGLTVPDAVALLEAHGYCRDLDTLRLTEEQRTEALSAIRQDRLARGGRPECDEQHARRDVVASSRIERLDVQRWMTPKTGS